MTKWDELDLNLDPRRGLVITKAMGERVSHKVWTVLTLFFKKLILLGSTERDKVGSTDSIMARNWRWNSHIWYFDRNDSRKSGPILYQSILRRSKTSKSSPTNKNMALIEPPTLNGPIWSKWKYPSSLLNLLRNGKFSLFSLPAKFSLKPIWVQYLSK